MPKAILDTSDLAIWSDDTTEAGLNAPKSRAYLPQLTLPAFTPTHTQQNGNRQADSTWNAYESVPRFRSGSPTQRAVSRVLHHWRGIVQEIRGNEFLARLQDLTDSRMEEEQAWFESDEVSEADIPLLREGAIFYLSVSYEERPGGQRVRSAAIRFQRLPGWTKQSIQRAQARANEWQRLLEEASDLYVSGDDD